MHKLVQARMLGFHGHMTVLLPPQVESTCVWRENPRLGVIFQNEKGRPKPPFQDLQALTSTAVVYAKTPF